MNKKKKLYTYHADVDNKPVIIKAESPQEFIRILFEEYKPKESYCLKDLWYVDHLIIEPSKYMKK